MERKNVLVALLMVLLQWSVCDAATLLDADWATGSTCNTTNIADGVWSQGGTGAGVCSDACQCYTIGTGGYGNRNYLSILMPSSGSGNINGNTSFLNPATVYVRFWFRMPQFVSTEHPIFLNSTTSPSAGVCLFRGYDQTFSIIPGTGAAVYYYTSNLSLNTWYRLEFKITGGGGSSGTVEVRLDGNDITSSMENYTEYHTLAQDNGSFTIPALNYLNIESYDKPPYTGSWLHIAGLFVTDGPDWIGGDALVGSITNITIGPGVSFR